MADTIYNITDLFNVKYDESLGKNLVSEPFLWGGQNIVFQGQE